MAVLPASYGCRYRWLIGESSLVDETAGDLYRSELASEYPPMPKSSWLVEEDGTGPAPSLTALDAVGQQMVPGWASSNVSPAAVAVATYVASQWCRARRSMEG